MESSLKPYEGSEPYIFVSYSYKDSKKVFAILERLQTEGFNFWYNQSKELKISYNQAKGLSILYNGDTELQESFSKILNCAGVIVFHSKSSAKSERCNDEIFFARQQCNKKIFSVYLEEVKLSLGVRMKISRFPSIQFYEYDETERENFYSEFLPKVKALLTNSAVVGSVILAVDSAIGVPASAPVLTAGVAGVAGVTGVAAIGVGTAGGAWSRIFGRILGWRAHNPDNEKSLSAYEGSKPYVFISYSHEDSDKVFEIIGKLQAKGLRFWYDAGIKKGLEWQKCIAEHIRDCECTIAFHSKSSRISEHCKDEIFFARHDFNKKILSVYLENVELDLGIKMSITRFQYINFYEYAKDKQKFFSELLESPLLQPCF